MSIHWSMELLSIHRNEGGPSEGMKHWYMPQHAGNRRSGGSQTHRAACRVIPQARPWGQKGGERSPGPGESTGAMRRACFDGGCVWGFFLGWWKCSDIEQEWWLHNLRTILKTTELYTFDRWILWNVNSISAPTPLSSDYDFHSFTRMSSIRRRRSHLLCIVSDIFITLDEYFKWASSRFLRRRDWRWNRLAFLCREPGGREPGGREEGASLLPLRGPGAFWSSAFMLR